MLAMMKQSLSSSGQSRLTVLHILQPITSLKLIFFIIIGMSDIYFVCKQGFTGTFCEIRECPRGMSGTNCSDSVNECRSNPCINGGTCVDGPSRFRCLCPPMYYGSHCQYFLPESSTAGPSGQDCSVSDCLEKAGNGQCDVRAVCCSLLDVKKPGCCRDGLALRPKLDMPSV